MFEARLYSVDSDVALMNGANEVWEFDDMSEAIAHARGLVVDGYYARGLVVEDDEDDIYDTRHDEGLNPKPLPLIAPLGPRLRRSPLAERLVGMRSQSGVVSH